MGIVFALIYAALNGLSKTFLKISYVSFSSSQVYMIQAVFCFIIFLPFSLTQGVNLDSILKLLPFVLLSAVLSEAYIFYIFTKGSISIIESVFTTYPIYTIIIASFFYGEVITQGVLVFILIVILGITTLGFPDLKNIKKDLKFKAVLWGLSGALAVAFSDSLSKNVISTYGYQNFLFALAFIQIFVAIIFMRLEKRDLRNFSINVYKSVIIATLLMSLSLLFFWLSYTFSLVSIASPVSGTSVMFTLLFSRLILKEKLNLKSYLGIAIILLGMVGVTLLSIM